MTGKTIKQIIDNSVFKIGECTSIKLSKDHGLYIELEEDCNSKAYYFIEHNEIIEDKFFEPINNIIVMYEDNNIEHIINTFLRQIDLTS